MSVIAKTTVYGLDSKIKRIQTHLDNKLNWGTTEVYGKLQETQKNGGSILEVLKAGTGKDYVQPFHNDKITATIGFLVLSRTNNRLVNLDIIFTVNLEKIFTNDVREDEFVLAYARRALKTSGMIIEFVEIKEGNENVFSGFEHAQHRDMHPFYVFSFNCNVRYVDAHSMVYLEEALNITTEGDTDITDEVDEEITIG